MMLGSFRHGIPEYVKGLKESEYSDNTIKKYSLALRNFIEFIENNDHCGVICKDCIVEYKEYLKQKYALNTANLYLVAINKYLKCLGESELCVKTFKVQSHNSLENCLTKEEYFSMLETAKNMKNNTIYYVMRALASTGMRVKGLEYITVKTIQRGSFTATNKGKTRAIVIPNGVCTEILVYCNDRNISSGYVFPDRSRKKPVSEVTVLRWLKAVAVKACVDPDKAFPHNLRHLFAKTFMEIHSDLGELADILGHTKIETTRIYTRTSLEEKRKNMELLGL